MGHRHVAQLCRHAQNQVHGVAGGQFGHGTLHAQVERCAAPLDALREELRLTHIAEGYGLQEHLGAAQHGALLLVQRDHVHE